MDAASGRQFANGPFLIGTLLFVCALAFYYFAVLTIDYHKTMLLDLSPYPDATEYFSQQQHSQGRPAFDTDRIRKIAVKASFWLSSADASMVESPVGRRGRRAISDESNDWDCCCFWLCLPFTHTLRCR